MESLMIWSVTIVLTGTVLALYIRRILKTHQSDAAEKRDASRLGIDKAPTQHPIINLDRCIGCGCCTTACPEGRVLGVVNGKSTLINGLKCIGHGHCALACPVGAITVGLGDISQRSDIPLLTADLETSLPGLFIAGELGGLALIRNAIDQGRHTIEVIAGREKSDNPSVYDVAIIGAGPAGISAALSAKAAGLSHIIIDRQGPGGTILKYPKRKLVMVQPVELALYGWLDRPEYSKEELVEIWEHIHRHFELNIKVGVNWKTIVKHGSHFDIATDEKIYQARHVVLALGRRGSPRKLGIPGEELGKVLYQLADAAEITHSRILIVGGGDSAVEAAMALALCEKNEVTLSYRKDRFYRIKKRNEERLVPMIEAGKLKVLMESEPLSITADSVRLKTPKGEVTLENDWVYIFAGGEAPFGALQQMGIDFGGGRAD